MTGVAHGSSTLDGRPTYDDLDLNWSLDDQYHPSDITVFDVEHGSPTTTWLTMSIDFAFDLEACR